MAGSMAVKAQAYSGKGRAGSKQRRGARVRWQVARLALVEDVEFLALVALLDHDVALLHLHTSGGGRSEVARKRREVGGSTSEAAGRR